VTASHLMHLNDIVESAEKILRYTGKLSYEQFCESELVVDAVLRNLEVIGEASACVPEKIQKTYPAVPWRLMKGMGNILIHEYFAVDLEIVWKTIQESLPKLLVAVEKLFQRRQSPTRCLSLRQLLSASSCLLSVHRHLSTVICHLPQRGDYLLKSLTNP